MDTMEKEVEEREERNLFLERIEPLVNLAKRNLVPKATVGLLFLSAVFSACRAEGSQQPQFPTETPTIPPSPTVTIEKMPSQTPPVSPEATLPPTPTAQPIPEVTVTQEAPIPRFGQIREKIENSQAPYEQIEEALELIGQFEKTDKVLTEIKEIYSQKTEADGTPTLLALTKSKFHNLDLAPLWQGKFASEEEFLESQIPFLRTAQRVDMALGRSQALDWSSPQLPIDSIREIYQSVFDSRTVAGQEALSYLQLGTEIDKEAQVTIRSDVQPQNPAEEARIEEQKTKIQNILTQAPLYGKFDLDIVIYRSGSPTVGYFDPGLDPPAIFLDLGATEEVIQYEYSHTLDPTLNPEFRRRGSPEDEVENLIARERALQDERWGTTFPWIEKICAPEWKNIMSKISNNQPLSPSEFAILSTPKDYWFQGAENPIDIYINKDVLQEFGQKTTDKPMYTVSEFVQGESVLLDELAQKDERLAVIVKKIRENPDQFNEYVFATSSHGFWSSGFIHIARLIIIQGQYQNDPEIVKYFPPTPELTILQKNMEEETLNRAVTNTFVLGEKGLLINPEGNPYLRILEQEEESLKAN